MRINVKEARKNFSALLNSVEEGNSISILRHGKKVARIIPPENNLKRLPSLKQFRNSIKISRKIMSVEIIEEREKARH